MLPIAVLLLLLTVRLASVLLQTMAAPSLALPAMLPTFR